MDYATQKILDERLYLGLDAKNQQRAVGIRREDRRYPLLINGRSGVGKSTLLEHLVLQDMQAGFGVVLFDPHGDISERLHLRVPLERSKDLMYFEPSDKTPTIDFAECVKNHKIVIVNLSRGKIGGDRSRSIGNELLAALTTVMELQSAEAYPMTALYFDEAPNLDTVLFSRLLRAGHVKKHVSIVLASNYLAQWSEDFFQNHLSAWMHYAVFSCAHGDAEYFAEDFGSAFTTERLRDQPKYHFFISKFEHDLRNQEAEQLISFPPLI